MIFKNKEKAQVREVIIKKMTSLRLQFETSTSFKGLFTWREEDPGTRKILEGETTFHLVYMQKFPSPWLPRGEREEGKLLAFRSWTLGCRHFVLFSS